MKILIADDDLMVHEILRSVCMELGYETVCVTDGREAWEAIKEDKDIRVSIIDWMMPGIDGLQLCRMIREDKGGRYLYIILLTSKAGSSDIVSGLNAGADDYIVKPFNYEELKMRILIGRRIVELEDRLLSAQEDLIKKNQRLAELNEIKSDFVSIVSHELRTPLTSIKNAINIVGSGKAGDTTKDQQTFLFMAERNINRLAGIINDLLDLSKLEAGKMVMRFQEMDLKDSLNMALSSFKSELVNKSIVLRKEIPTDLPCLYADPDKITQVFINLIENAIKFVPKGGEISIIAKPIDSPPAEKVGGDQDLSTSKEGQNFNLREQSFNSLAEAQYIKVSVSDSGIGIPPEQLAYVFDKFHQVSKPLTRKVGGTGLGLTIIKKIIEEHHGKIWAECKPGPGTQFTFILPQWKSRNIIKLYRSHEDES